MAVNKKEIGRRIKKIRVIDLDMNQDEFAGKLAITQSTVSRYEKGEVIPPGDILLKIAKLGKTTMENILEGGQGEQMSIFTAKGKLLVPDSEAE